MQIRQLIESPNYFASGVPVDGPKSRFATALTFVQFVETGDDFIELQNEASKFGGISYAPDAVPGLVALLKHQSPDVRRRAVTALLYVKQRPDLATDALLKLLDDAAQPDGEQGDSVRGFAAVTLAEYKAVEALPKLRELMMDDNCEIAAQAALMIHRIDPTIEIGARLIDLCKSKYRGNRWYAAQDLPHHVDAVTVSSVLAEMFEVTDPSDDLMRGLIAAQMNDIAGSRK
jgi:HEAT repeat protein